MSFIHFNGNFPHDVKFFTSGKYYEIVKKINVYDLGRKYQVFVNDDNGIMRGPINIGQPCAYLDDNFWSVTDD